jgi:hypothetical protein
MARTTTTRRMTRLDREAASAGAQRLDLAPLARVSLVIVGVLVLAVGASIAVPDPRSIGGPLQDVNVATAASLQTIRKVGGGAVSVGIFVPWNASDGTVVLDTLVPMGADGVEVVKTGVVPAGATAIDPTRGFPPPGINTSRVEGWSVPPGSGPLDGLQLVVGLRGRGHVLAFVLRYHRGGTVHHALITQGAMLCAASCEDRIGVAERQRALAASWAPYLDAPGR